MNVVVSPLHFFGGGGEQNGLNMKLSEIKSNPNNPRVIRDDAFDKLKKSIEEFPKMMALRPIVVDANNIVLGGNMRLRALQDIGYKEVPDEWVRNAADLTPEEQHRFIIADNVGFGDWDLELLLKDWSETELSNWGLSAEEIDFDNDALNDAEDIEAEFDAENPYSKKISAPTYEPTGEKPDIKELCDTSKYRDLLVKIEQSNVSDTVKDFLMLAASRHIVFNYQNIAEFYAHLSADEQGLFEDSALVIIDFGDAIKKGYIEMTKDITNLYHDDYE